MRKKKRKEKGEKDALIKTRRRKEKIKLIIQPQMSRPRIPVRFLTVDDRKKPPEGGKKGGGKGNPF